jgi:hypothetical protein
MPFQVWGLGPHSTPAGPLKGWSDGEILLSDVMPWKAFRNMDDDELGALYAYLKSLPTVTN